jgi:hypothetical protein
MKLNAATRLAAAINNLSKRDVLKILDELGIGAKNISIEDGSWLVTAKLAITPASIKDKIATIKEAVDPRFFDLEVSKRATYIIAPYSENVGLHIQFIPHSDIIVIDGPVTKYSGCKKFFRDQL